MSTRSVFSSIEHLEEQLRNFKEMGGYIINPLGNNSSIDLEVGETIELPTTGQFQLLKGFDKNGKPYGLKQFGVMYSDKEYFITVPENYTLTETLRCKVSTYTSKSGKEVKTFEFLPTVAETSANVTGKIASAIAEKTK